MRLPNWFRVAWWMLLLLASTAFLFRRYDSLSAGTTTPIDALVVVFWIALVLAPIFYELSFLGVSLKQKIEEVKKDIKEQVLNLRSEVQSAVSVSTSLNQQLILPTPPSDSDLPDLREQVREAIESTLGEKGLQTGDFEANLSVDSDVSYLFQVRLHLEKELRRLWTQRLDVDEGRRSVSVFRIAQELAKADLIQPNLVGVIREVYSICSPAVHGQPVTEAQVAFVRDVAPEIVRALRGLR